MYILTYCTVHEIAVPISGLWDLITL